MTSLRFILGVSVPLLFVLTGCEKPITADNFDNWMPGKPKVGGEWKPPTATDSFTKLFAQNCRGCHGDGQTVGGSINLKDPTLLAILPADELRNLIINGVSGASMPAFALRNGGQLTDAQIEILVAGIQAWKDPATTPPGPLPPYSATLGDPVRGEEIYKLYSASILEKNPKLGVDGFMLNPSFLGLVSNQYLRLMVIAGRPELGIPNWQNAIPGKPLSDEEIADLVAWLVSQRQNEFGQPMGLPPSTNL